MLVKVTATGCINRIENYLWCDEFTWARPPTSKLKPPTLTTTHTHINSHKPKFDTHPTITQHWILKCK